MWRPFLTTLVMSWVLAGSVRSADPAIDPKIMQELGMPASAVDNALLHDAILKAVAQFEADLHRPAGVPRSELDVELHGMDAMRRGEQTDFAAVEKLAESMLDQYKDPAQRGRICAMVAQVYGQSGCKPPTITWARKALELPLDPREALRMHMYCGDAMFLKNAVQIGKGDIGLRRDVAMEYLLGIKEAMRYSLPERKPGIPVLGRVAVDDGDRAPREIRGGVNQHDQIVKWVAARFVCDMIDYRDVLIGQMVRIAMRLKDEQVASLRPALLNEQNVDRLIAAARKKDAKEYEAAEREILLSMLK